MHLVLYLNGGRVGGCSFQLALLSTPLNVSKLASEILLRSLFIVGSKFIFNRTFLKHPCEVDVGTLGKFDVESNLLVLPSPQACCIFSSLYHAQFSSVLTFCPSSYNDCPIWMFLVLAPGSNTLGLVSLDVGPCVVLRHIC